MDMVKQGHGAANSAHVAPARHTGTEPFNTEPEHITPRALAATANHNHSTSGPSPSGHVDAVDHDATWDARHTLWHMEQRLHQSQDHYGQNQAADDYLFLPVDRESLFESSQPRALLTTLPNDTSAATLLDASPDTRHSLARLGAAGVFVPTSVDHHLPTAEPAVQLAQAHEPGLVETTNTSHAAYGG